MAEVAWQRASTLSGGQQQRAAIAQALLPANQPIASADTLTLANLQDEILEGMWRRERQPMGLVFVGLFRLAFL